MYTEYLKIGKPTFYKMAREDKILAVRVELRRNNKFIIQIPYNQELIKKVRTLSKRKWNWEGDNNVGYERVIRNAVP